jgi:hypothetical protein
MHRLIQNLVGEGEVLVIPIPVKKVPAAAACILLRKNFQNGVPGHTNTKIPCVYL